MKFVKTAVLALGLLLLVQGTASAQPAATPAQPAVRAPVPRLRTSAALVSGW